MERMVLVASDIAEALNTGINTAYALMHREDFPSIRIGRKLVVPRDAFLRWLDRQTEKAEARA